MLEKWSEIWEFRTALYNSLASYLLEMIQEEKKNVLTPNFWRNYPIEPANPHLEAGLEQLITSTSELKKLSVEDALEQVAIEYTELFIGLARPKAPPVESFYYTNKKSLFDVKTFEMKQMLNKHGLESKRKGKQPEDHLGLKLLFIAVKTEQLHTLDPDKHSLVIGNQIIFINKHILSWIPELCKDAKEHGTAGFYGGLIELIWGTLIWDRELLKEFIDTHNYVLQ